MRFLSLSMKMFALAAFAFALASAAQAQAVRTWVSQDNGDDVNPCSRSAPCRTFAGAVSKTAPGGEINTLDAGSYGAVTINKALTIDGGGHLAGISANLANGITVNAAAGDTVVLRNITINGLDANFTGVRYLGGGQLFMDDMEIQRMGANGIFIEGTDPANPLRAEITNCRLKGNRNGIQIENNAKVAIHHCIITGVIHKGGNSFGVNVVPAAGTEASVKLEENEISHCSNGVRLVGSDLGGGTVKMWTRNNHIFANTIGWNATNTYELHSAGGNIFTDNVTATSGSIANASVTSF